MLSRTIASRTLRLQLPQAHTRINAIRNMCDEVSLKPPEEIKDKNTLNWQSGFDAWGANELHRENTMLTSDEEYLLTDAAVSIPFIGETDADVDVPAILDAYDKKLQKRSGNHFGYPYNLQYDHTELLRFMKYSINNLGDPFVDSNYGVHSRVFERAVIGFMAKLWKLPDPEDHWGYVTTCGTEGNLHAMLLAREVHPDGVIFASRETHYSIFKAAKYYRMEAEEIDTLPSGEIDYYHLADRLKANIDKPAIINVNIGTTVKGAVDNLDRVLRTLRSLNIPRERTYIHCDGALFAMMMPFVEHAPEISFDKPIDSVAVSGHKMLGCPMPCGIALTRRRHIEKVEQHIAYLNSVDTTIMGSRNGQAALYLWYSMMRKGIDGIKADVEHCMNTARYLRDQLQDAGFVARLNDLSCTVVLERPVSSKFVSRWQLACEDDIAHVVVMPNVTCDKIKVFVQELQEAAEEYGRIAPQSATSPLSEMIANKTW